MLTLSKCVDRYQAAAQQKLSTHLQAHLDSAVAWLGGLYLNQAWILSQVVLHGLNIAPSDALLDALAPSKA